MASFSLPPFLLLLATTLFLSSTSTTSTAGNHTGLTLTLIHRNTLESGNLTTADLHRRHRLHRHKPLGTKARAPVSNEFWEYAVMVRIGTPAIPLLLILDTGSQVTWTQCHPCDPCYPQDPPHFIPASSSSYAVLPRNDPRCVDPAEGDGCAYVLRYSDGGEAKGRYATETLTLESVSGEPVVVNNFVLGCTTISSVDMFGSTAIGGILGMDMGPRSFMRQTQPSINGGRFSYCMAPPERDSQGYLSFGDDIPPLAPNAQTIPFVPAPEEQLYYLDMVGIGFNGDDLGIPPEVFSIQPDGTGGTIIDTGAQHTILVTAAYEPLIEAMDDHIEALGYDVVDPDGDERCYGKEENDDPHELLPTVTFNFRGGAELVLPPDNLFEFYPNKFCVALANDEEEMMIGALQMKNIRFVFDLGSNQLTFAPEVCGQGEGISF